jgi:hypothetical protein
MKTAGLLALALLSTGTRARAAEDAAKPKPALSARLENPKMAEDAKSLTVDFVLTNQSEKQVIFAERWNSWGADQWTLKLHVKDGQTVEFTNPQQCWTMNYLTVVTLEPGKEHRSHFLLCLTEPSPWPKALDPFTPAKKEPKLQDFKTASGISGVFAVKSISTESPDGQGKAVTNWTGEVIAEKIELAGK